MGAELTIGKLAEAAGVNIETIRFEKKMADLAAMHQVLDGLVKQCDAGDGNAACPIINVLVRE